MTIASVVTLLQTALLLLTLSQSTPNIPQATRDYAAQVAHQAIDQATLALATSGNTSITSSTPTSAVTLPTDSVPSSIFLSLTAPQAGSTVVIGNAIPVTWNYTGAPSNSQITLALTAVQTTPGLSGNGGGTWQSTLLGAGSGTGSYSWPTGYGKLDIPGTYELTAKLRACDPRGCSYNPDFYGTYTQTYASVAPVRITITSTDPSISVLGSAGGQISASFQNMPRAGVRVVRQDTGLSAWTQELNSDGSANGNIYINITNGIGAATYRLEAYGSDGTVYAKSGTFYLQGNAPSVTCYATSDKYSVLVGDTFHLAWGSAGASYMTGIPTQDSWPVNGSQAISVAQPGSRTYDLVFHGQNGEVQTCSVTVYVSASVSVDQTGLYATPGTPFTIHGVATVGGMITVVLVPVSYAGDTSFATVSNLTKGNGPAVSNSTTVTGSFWSAPFGGLAEGDYAILVYDQSGNLVAKSVFSSTWKG